MGAWIEEKRPTETTTAKPVSCGSFPVIWCPSILYLVLVQLSGLNVGGRHCTDISYDVICWCAGASSLQCIQAFSPVGGLVFFPSLSLGPRQGSGPRARGRCNLWGSENFYAAHRRSFLLLEYQPQPS